MRTCDLPPDAGHYLFRPLRYFDGLTRSLLTAGHGCVQVGTGSIASRIQARDWKIYAQPQPYCIVT